MKYPKRIPRGRWWLVIAGAALAAAAAVALAAGTSTTPPVRAAADTAADLAPLRESGKAFARVARQVSPSVVYVKVEKTVAQAGLFGTAMPGSGGLSGDDLLQRFFGFPFGQPEAPREEHVVGQGSGFIVASDGRIITNNHVVGDADKITVTLDDGRELPARVVGTDPHSDVAVIQVEADNLPALELGDSDAIEVGEWVVAVGNPFGLTHTITAGIVSAKGRSRVGIADYEDFIQTDAAINPGNSGGPLIDLDGRVVGMNTAIYSRSGGSLGIGFAIPINMVKSISDQLISDGAVTRGYLGVAVQDLTPTLGRSLGLEARQGALVAQVVADTPAAAAGLESGDVITAVDGQPVTDTGEFRNRIAMTEPGTKVDLAVIRNGKPRTVSVTLGRLTDGDVVAGGQSREDHAASHGLTVQNLTPDLAARLGLEGQQGVVIGAVARGSDAEAAGLQPGDLIVEVNRKPVTSVHEFSEALASGGPDDAVLLLVHQGRFARYVVLGGR